MAASTDNRMRNGKAGRAVTAALIGALTVGAPVVALAAGPGSIDAAGDVDLMVATPAELFSKGSLAAAKTDDSDEVDIIAGVPIEIVKTPGAPTYLVPTQVLPDGPESKPVNVTSDEFEVTYWTDRECAQYQISDLDGADWNPGTYYVKIEAKAGTYKGGVLVVEFKVTPASLEGATLVDCGPVGGGELTSTSFTYSGSPQDVGVALGGDLLREEDYSLTFKVAGTDTVVRAEDLIDAGAYDAYIAGRNAYEGSLEVVTFTIGSLDLSKAELALADTTENVNVTYAEQHLTIDGAYNETLTNDSNRLSITPKSGPSADGSANGTYVFAVTPAAGVTRNIVGSGTVSASKVGTLVDNHALRFECDGKAIEDETTVDLSKGESFDLSKIAVADASGKEVVPADAVEVSIADEQGRVLDMTGKVTTPGTYVVTYRVDAEKTDYAYGSGTFSTELTVIAGKVEDSDAILYFDGEIAEGTETVTYSGEDYLELLDPHITCGEKVLVEGEDYRFDIWRDGKRCDSIVDAGLYLVTFVSDSYDFSDVGSIQIDVKGYDLSTRAVKVEFDGTTKAVVDGEVAEVMPYTGEAYEPRVYVALTTDDEGTQAWTELDASDYALTVLYNAEDGSQLEELDANVSAAGYYAIGVAARADRPNYTGGTTVYRDASDQAPFVVTSEKCFPDVPASEWYAEAVAVAVDQGYIKGINDGSTFEPLSTLDRAQFVTVLYRMAGGDTSADGKPYDTGFSDVAPSAWYAKALAWAAENGIVTGYPDGTFGGSDPIQTEQMVTMLARYAELKGDYSAPTDVEGVLASVADGGSVSAYAREYVAWAVDQGLIGRDGALVDPQGEISRGRTVTIAVRYQPEQASITE